MCIHGFRLVGKHFHQRGEPVCIHWVYIIPDTESLILRRVHFPVEYYLLFCHHLLQYLHSLNLSVCVVQVSLVYCLQQKMNFLAWFGAICVQNAQNKALDNVSEVALH